MSAKRDRRHATVQALRGCADGTPVMVRIAGVVRVNARATTPGVGGPR